MGTLKQGRQEPLPRFGTCFLSKPSPWSALDTPSEGFWIILQIKHPQTRSEHYAGETVHGTPWDSTGEPHACDAALNQLMESLPL